MHGIRPRRPGVHVFEAAHPAFGIEVVIGDVEGRGRPGKDVVGSQNEWVRNGADMSDGWRAKHMVEDLDSPPLSFCPAKSPCTPLLAAARYSGLGGCWTAKDVDCRSGPVRIRDHVDAVCADEAWEVFKLQASETS